MSKQELRLAGSGGQGVILASVILAEAAVLAGKYAAQSQSYGPEARGGACRAETLISDSPIGFTKVQRPGLLMALTQKALDQYARDLPEGCTLLVDEELAPPEAAGCAVVRAPILKTARETVGRQQTANIVAVGCINALLKLTDPETLKRAVLMHVPKGTEALNMRALEEGEKLALTAPAERSARGGAEPAAKTPRGAKGRAAG